MPYWPSSRVGAVPQPSTKPKQQQKRSERFGRQKGITMEDLKKQTALRLAQEQNRKGGAASAPSPPSASSGGGFHGNIAPVVATATPPRTTVHSTRSNSQPTPMPPPPRPSPQPSYPSVDLSSSGSSSPSPYSSQAPQRNDARLEPYSFERSSSVGQRTAPPPHRAPPAAPARPEYISTQEAHHHASPYCETTSTTNGKQQPKSKLPHGLTVQELKEMTKARLQAEAASKNGHTETGGVIGHTLSEPPPSRTEHHPPPPPPLRGQPPQALRAVSPAPPGFAAREVQPHHHHLGWSERAENWETLSLGGGGPVPSGGNMGGPPSDVYLMVPSQAIIASELDGNRSRASTMSPHLNLSMHEEPRSLLDSGISYHSEPRERTFSEASNSVAYSVGTARERSFSTEAHVPPSTMFVHRERAFSSDNHHHLNNLQHHHLHHPGSNALVQRSLPSAFNATPPGNRARTSSAASMPPISHTADEFGMDAMGPGPVGSSFNRFASRFGAVREDAPLTPGLADVFRVSSFDKSPLTMLPSSSTSSSSSPNHSAVVGPSMFATDALSVPTDNRLRASTWSEPGSLFGSVGDFADDLASILKLSGAEDSNHFLSSSS
ncbi:hypothetical protein ACA910_017597 [Epithemia clementina (nom. ined.)]